jgi:hypothetical protein
VISGCFENRGGDLRVIDAESGATCNTRETPISWNTPSPILRSEGYPGAVGMNLYSYFMATADQTPQTFRFGQVNVETTGVPGDFRLCDPISHLGAFLYVAYVNGVRSVGSIPPAGCTPSFTVGSGGDFRLSARRTQIFGVDAGDFGNPPSYNLFGISQLAPPLSGPARKAVP